MTNFKYLFWNLQYLQIECIFPNLIGKLKAEQNVTLKLASKIYSTDKYPLSEDFLDDTKLIFDAEAETLNFNDAQASADAVNKWVTFIIIKYMYMHSLEI